MLLGKKINTIDLGGANNKWRNYTDNEVRNITRSYRRRKEKIQTYENNLPILVPYLGYNKNTKDDNRKEDNIIEHQRHSISFSSKLTNLGNDSHSTIDLCNIQTLLTCWTRMETNGLFYQDSKLS